MAKKVSKNSRIDTFYVLIVLPLVFVLMVVTYLFAVKISANNSRVCKYIGRLWLAGNPQDPSSLKGCYTYGQLAQKGGL